ncbi:hypothetical protein SAY86_025421 [Trapa natans]|uniref:Uncharacterized protein n=1 Tax=Trapa natans TaxID=22666 RepID=A0AAN7RJ03_TRANT|nr:hypothetical protein SAY86_025421 [Trapa natans]
MCGDRTSRAYSASICFSIIFCVVIVWIYAHLLTVGGAYNNAPLKTQVSCRTDCSGLIDAAPWISVPYPFQWGPPSFDAGEAFAMMMASFVALVEGVGILMSGVFGTANGCSVSVKIWGGICINPCTNRYCFVLCLLCLCGCCRCEFSSVLQPQQLPN